MHTVTRHALKDFIRHPFAFPGGYPKALLMGDGETLCSKCARENYRQMREAFRRQGCWYPEAVFIHYEGRALECGHCGAETESACGDPDAEEGGV